MGTGLVIVIIIAVAFTRYYHCLFQVQAALKKQMSDIESSPYSVAELEKAEADIDTISSKLDEILNNWRQAQVKAIADFKKEATDLEEKLTTENIKLQSLLDSDIDVSTLVTKLTQESQDPMLNPPRQSGYNFAERCEILENSLSEEIRSQDFKSSKLLKQNPAPDVKPKRKWSLAEAYILHGFIQCGHYCTGQEYILERSLSLICKMYLLFIIWRWQTMSLVSQQIPSPKAWCLLNCVNSNVQITIYRQYMIYSFASM